MSIGITGSIQSAQAKNDIKVIDVIFESNGIKYEVSDLSLASCGCIQNEYRLYINGKCINDNVEYEQVSLRIHLSQDLPLTYHITTEDFINQEADLYLD